MADNLRSKAFSGVAWKLIERFSVEIFGFIVGIILARKLDPSDYGLVAMTAIFFSISYLLIDAGFSTALVRKKDRTEIDYSTAYLTNVVLSLLFIMVVAFLLHSVTRMPPLSTSESTMSLPSVDRTF